MRRGGQTTMGKSARRESRRIVRETPLPKGSERFLTVRRKTALMTTCTGGSVRVQSRTTSPRRSEPGEYGFPSQNIFEYVAEQVNDNPKLHFGV